jgi:hypothetical protein
MIKDPYSSIELVLKELDTLLAGQPELLKNLKKQLEHPIDQAFFSIDSIHARLAVIDPYRGYTLLPETLESVCAIVNQTTPHIANQTIQQSLVSISNNILTLKSQLPKPLATALDLVQRFINANGDNLGGLPAKTLPSIEEAIQIIDKELPLSTKSDQASSLLTEKLQIIIRLLNEHIPTVKLKSIADPLSHHAKIIHHLAAPLFSPTSSNTQEESQRNTTGPSF